MTNAAATLNGLANLDSLFSADELAVRASVRRLCADRIDPFVADWFESGRIEDVRGLTKELGSLGVLGMHLQGYGCAGMSAIDYGLACLELEATDSGIRSLVSVGIACNVRHLEVRIGTAEEAMAPGHGRG